MNKAVIDQSWDYFRTVNGIGLRAIAALPADKLDAHPIPGMRTPKELVVHLYTIVVALPAAVAKGEIKDTDEEEAATVQRIRTKDELVSVWGGIGGEIMYKRIRGEPQAEGEVETHSISHSSVLGPDRRNTEDAFAVLNRLTQKAAQRLRKAGYYAGRLSVDLKYLDGGHWHSDMRLVDTQDTVTFLHALEKLWSKRPKGSRTILKVGMAFSDFVGEAHRSGSLFASEDRSRALYKTLDKLNARFGRQAVYFASAHKARDRSGLAIAFNHIPDPETEK